MSSQPPESDGTTSNDSPLPADEMLPPVEPPNARFLIQLFVIPAVIVLIVVCLWLLVTSLANSDNLDPQKIVNRLRSSNQNRWQEAYELANMLQVEKRYPKLRRDTELARELAGLLAEESEAGEEGENAVKLRMFLCSALGAFKVEEGLTELLDAAREDPDNGVRRAAIDALAVRAQTALEQEEPTALDHPEMVATFVALANQPDDLIRSQTAYALGVITQAEDSDPGLTDELVKLVDDLHLDTRYNAALALARRGDLRSVSAIREMLDRDSITMSVNREAGEAQQTYKRNLILRNALQAAQRLTEKNPAADLAELELAIEEFVAEAPSWDDYDKSLEALVEQGQKLIEAQENK